MFWSPTSPIVKVVPAAPRYFAKSGAEIVMFPMLERIAACVATLCAIVLYGSPNIPGLIATESLSGAIPRAPIPIACPGPTAENCA